MKGNERQAEREEGSERGRDEWRAAGVEAGQASCQGAPLTPCTERRRDTKRRREQREGSEEKERKRAGSEGSRMMTQKKKVRAESVKESDVRSQSLQTGVGESLISLLISQQASHTAFPSPEQTETLGLDMVGRAGYWLCVLKQAMFAFGPKRFYGIRIMFKFL